MQNFNLDANINPDLNYNRILTVDRFSRRPLPTLSKVALGTARPRLLLSYFWLVRYHNYPKWSIRVVRKVGRS